MNKLIAIVLIALISSPSFAVEAVRCKNLWWKLTVEGKPAIFRGTVKAGTVDVIHIEVRKDYGKQWINDWERYRTIGLAKGFPNPGGSWEVTVWGDFKIDRLNLVKFFCEKYTNNEKKMGAIIENLEQELRHHKRLH